MEIRISISYTFIERLNQSCALTEVIRPKKTDRNSKETTFENVTVFY